MYRKLAFQFNGIYIQIDEIAMVSLLGPVIAIIFMVKLESVLVPKLNDDVKQLERFVNDIFVYVKRSFIEYVLSVINSLHDNIKFTYEQENNNRLPFLTRDDEKVTAIVFRKDIWSHFHKLAGNKGH